MDNFKEAGFLGGDPELKWGGQDGQTAIVSFSVAVSRPQFKKDAPKITDWFRCKMFGKRAETVAANFKKGDSVMVSGRVELNKWTNPEGVEKEFCELNTSDIQWVGKKVDGGGQSDRPPHPAEREAGPRQPAQNQQQQSTAAPSRPVSPGAAANPVPVQAAYPTDDDFDPDDPFADS